MLPSVSTEETCSWADDIGCSEHVGMDVQGRDPVASVLGARAEDHGVCVQRHPL